MKPERWLSPPALMMALLGAAIGLVLVAGGWIWGVIPLLLGGGALIGTAAGRPLRLPQFVPGRALKAAPLRVPALGRNLGRPSWLAIAFMFVLGFAVGMVLDRLLMAATGAKGDVLSALAASITEARLIETKVRVGSEVITIRHSELDIGQPGHIFDDDFGTLMRGKGDNPFIFEVSYPQPREARAVVLDLATMEDYELKLVVTRADGQSFVMYEEGSTRLVDPSIEFSFPMGVQLIRTVRVEILDRRPPPQEGFHIHVRGFSLR